MIDPDIPPFIVQVRTIKKHFRWTTHVKLANTFRTIERYGGPPYTVAESRRHADSLFAATQNHIKKHPRAATYETSLGYLTVKYDRGWLSLSTHNFIELNATDCDKIILPYKRAQTERKATSERPWIVEIDYLVYKGSQRYYAPTVNRTFTLEEGIQRMITERKLETLHPSYTLRLRNVFTGEIIPETLFV